MVKRIFIPVIILLLLLLAGPVLSAEEADNGIIEGQLVNETTGSKVSDQTVMLLAYQGNADVYTKTAQTDGGGRFIFEGLSTDASYIFGVGVRYQGVEYYSGSIQFATGETSKSVDVAVYNTTSSDEAITVTMSHAIVDFENNVLKVKEYFLIANNSKYTFVGEELPVSDGKRKSLQFSLPEGATNFESNYGLTNNDILNGTDINNSSPVLPGSTEISYLYNIPFTSDNHTLSFKINYTTTRFDLLLADENVKVKSAELTESEPLNIANRTYRDFAGQDLIPGDIVEAQLSALPRPTTISPEGNALKWAWLILIPVAVIGLILFKKRKSPTFVGDPDRENLLAEIAELDDRYEAQEINKQDYLSLREQKKQKLLKITTGKRG